MDPRPDDRDEPGELEEGGLSPAPSGATTPAKVTVREALGAVPGYDEFEINIEKVLRSDLPVHFESVTPAPLNKENIALLPERAKGAYLLHLDGSQVYAGKTDTRHGFRDRLDRHFNTVQHRKGLDATLMSFKAVRIMVFNSFDVEAILIGELRKKLSGSLPWNDSGFGSNDPGHRREGGEPADFDKEHPIDIDLFLDPSPLPPGRYNLRDALIIFKNYLPYTLRYETDLRPDGKPDHWRKGHVDQRSAYIDINDGPITTRMFINISLSALPVGWKSWVFPDRVILYKENATWPFALEVITR